MSIYQRKGTKHLLLDVTGSDGRRIRRSSGTSDLAQARLQHAALTLELSAASVIDIPAPSRSVTLGELAEQFLAYQQQMHPRSFGTYYRSNVKIFLEWAGADRRLDALLLKDLQSFQAQRLSSSSTTTANRQFQVIKTMLRLAVDWGLLAENPAVAIKRFREPGGRRRFLSGQEQEQLLAACQEPFRRVVLVALRTGMRRGELLDLRRRDVDFSRSHVTLLRTKTDHPRHIPLLPQVREALQVLAREMQADTKFFRSSKGGPYSPFGIRWNFDRAKRRAGLKDLHFHDLRHTFASDCLAAGVPMAVLRDWLGHTSVRTTERYAHLADRQIQMALEDLNRHLETRPRHS